jgi:hypothetical protein
MWAFPRWLISWLTDYQLETVGIACDKAFEYEVSS